METETMTLNNERFIVRASRGHVIVEDWEEPGRMNMLRLTMEESMKLRRAMEAAERVLVTAESR